MAATAIRELGELYLASESGQLAKLLKVLKSDRSIKELQDSFFQKSKH